MEPQKVQYHSAFRRSDTDLYSHPMHTVMDFGVSGVCAGVIRDLEAVVASRTDFSQQRLILL